MQNSLEKDILEPRNSICRIPNSEIVKCVRESLVVCCDLSLKSVGVAGRA